MCPPVLDGQPVSAAITNPAFIDAVDDDQALGVISFANTNPASGAAVTNIQKESNSAASFMGKALNSSATDLPVYTNNEVGSANDPLRTRVDALSGKFNAVGGHTHTGAAGDAPAITASDLASVPLRGYVRQGSNVTTGTGPSINVTIAFGAQNPGGSALVEGVVTDPPYNKILMRQTTGSETGNVFTDADGNEVYGRLTYAALNWTLSFFVDLAGVETSYSFPTTQIAAIFYQEIFNPMVNPPTYSEFAIIPSDNATADVVTATTAIQGKVSLATTAQDVGSSTSAGTANAVVANADHTHRGVADISKSGDPALYGSVTLSATGGTTLTQLAQDIAIDSVALTTAVTPSDVAGTAVIGVSTESAHADHVHAGVYAVDAGFGDKLGTVTVAATGQTVLSNTVGGFSIDSPAFTVAAAEDIASTGAAGVSTDMARADHEHRGIHSVSKFGDSQLFGDVTISAGSNITVTQTGQDIQIAGTVDLSTVVLRDGSQSMTGNLDMDGNDIVDVQEINFAELNNTRIYQDNTGFYINTNPGNPASGMTVDASSIDFNTGSFNVNEIGAGGIELKTTNGNINIEASLGNITVKPGAISTQFVVQCAGGAKIDNGLDVNFQNIVNVPDPINLGDAANKNYVDNAIGGGAATIVDVAASNAAIVAGDAVYLDGTGTIQRLDASDDSKVEFLGIAVSNGPGANQVQVAGEITITGASFTVGEPVFADPANPGDFSSTAPSNAGQWVIQVGVATASNKIAINGAGSATAVKITSEVDPYVYASVTAISANTTLTNANSIVLATAGAGGITITLPAPTAGKIFNIKKVDAAAGVVTITPPSGTIDGLATRTISIQYASLTITSDGTNFFIL